MKSRLIISFFLLLTLHGFTQNPNEIIERIEKQIQNIDIYLGSMDIQKSTFVYNCPQVSESGEMSVYTYLGDTVLISINRALGAHSGDKKQYYIQNNQVFFCRQTYSTWAFDPAYSSDSIPQTIDYFSNRQFYFSDSKPIACFERKWEERSVDKGKIGGYDPELEKINCADCKEIFEEFQKLKNIPAFNSNGKNCPFD